ncbi:unnamed protein product [Adineta steineri]|uniref:Uncharacterized protein n=1 Tax=Adineta steineri TaxID=433720 RepID=A0A814MYV7_9BILA|nr:unnamed protein product [Adineta steineri]CAF1624586.1 unnamed protein product [Adineta steineri]
MDQSTVSQDHNDHQSNTKPTESFQQLYFTKKTSNQVKNIVQPTIERWSSITQPSMTFYRVYMQDTYDNYYQPVNEERLRSSIEQSKAMEYAGLEIIFF